MARSERKAKLAALAERIATARNIIQAQHDLLESFG
jgi:hypothetical protein